MPRQHGELQRDEEGADYLMSPGDKNEARFEAGPRFEPSPAFVTG